MTLAIGDHVAKSVKGKLLEGESHIEYEIIAFEPVLTLKRGEFLYRPLLKVIG